MIVVCDIRIEIECELWLPFAFGKCKKMERKDERYHFFFKMIATLQRTLDTNTVYLLQLHLNSYEYIVRHSYAYRYSEKKIICRNDTLAAM